MNLPSEYIANIRQGVETELRNSLDDQGERDICVDCDDIVYAWRDGKATVLVEKFDNDMALNVCIELDVQVTVRNVECSIVT